MTTGSCLCGTVRFEMSAPYQWMANCHCSRCRKYHGTLYGTTIGVNPAQFRWHSGESEIGHYRSSPGFERAFCKQCGSPVPSITPDAVIVPAGALQEDPGAKPAAHIFVKFKSPMCEINDALPQFAEYPPGAGTAVDSPLPPSSAEDAITGGCLCGEVAFAIDETPRKVVNCHCTRCQRSRGSAHATNVFVYQEKLRWLRGEQLLRSYKVPDAPLFRTTTCARCGSLLPALFEGIKRYNVPVGSLDRPLDTKPRLHIHTRSRAAWHTITDQLEQFEEMPPNERVRELMF